jgi:ABC-type amino acid transport substrate-binding protein
MAASTPAATGRIFISYRRDDTDFPAGWLYERLAGHFGADQVFKDVDSIELGDDFVQVITTAVGSCDVLLAVIGDRWLTIADKQGRRRLDNTDDFVRLEIQAALEREIRVIPILIDEAKMPRAEELPDSMAGLARRQALELSPSRFDADTGRLLAVLDRTFAEVQEETLAGLAHTAPLPTPLLPRPPQPRPPRPHAPEPHAPEPHAPEPHLPEPHLPEPSRPQPRPRPPAPPRRSARRWLVPLVALGVVGVLVLAAVLFWPRPSPAPGGTAAGGGQGQEITPLPPGTDTLTVGYAARFAAAEGNDDSLVDGFFPILYHDPDTGKLRGFDVDLAAAIGRKLGAAVVFEPVEHFTHSLSDVSSRRVAIGMSVLRDRAEGRRDVDFIDYLDPGSALVVPRDDAAWLGSLADLCGKTVVRPIEMSAGSVIDQSHRCREEGRRGITLMSCPRIDGFIPDKDEGVPLRQCPAGRDPLQLVVEGQVDAAVLDLPVAQRLIKGALARQLVIAKPRVTGAPYGIAVHQDDTQVKEALRSALQALIDDGRYGRLLKTWGLQRYAVPAATVNDGR